MAVVPFAGVHLGEAASLLPAVLVVVACFDVLSVALLLGEFRDDGDRRVLCISGGYVWSLVTMLAYALACPDVVAADSPLGLMPAMAPWFYVVWHADFPMLLGLCWMPWPASWGHRTPASRRKAQSRATVAAAGLGGLATVTAMVLTADRLPVLIHGLDTGAMTALTAPVAMPLVLLSLPSTTLGTRHRTGPERWAPVAVLVCLADLALAYGARHRFSVGWYTGRTLTLVAAGLVLLVTVAALRREVAGPTGLATGPPVRSTQPSQQRP